MPGVSSHSPSCHLTGPPGRRFTVVIVGRHGGRQRHFDQPTFPTSSVSGNQSDHCLPTRSGTWPLGGHAAPNSNDQELAACHTLTLETVRGRTCLHDQIMREAHWA